MPARRTEVVGAAELFQTGSVHTAGEDVGVLLAERYFFRNCHSVSTDNIFPFHQTCKLARVTEPCHARTLTIPPKSLTRVHALTHNGFNPTGS